uniref:Uncharacterized protein n=1 Tax=Anguilla anguilla TaxID=7936 RepID=A0A0E9XHA3_ANGAN
MTLASAMKSSSDIEPSLIILTATSCCPCNFPYFTTPNCPLPSSFMKVRWCGSISQRPYPNPAVQGAFLVLFETTYFSLLTIPNCAGGSL